MTLNITGIERKAEKKDGQETTKIKSFQRNKMWVEDERKLTARWTTKLLAGDVIILDKSSGNISYLRLRSQSSQRMFIDDGDKRCLIHFDFQAVFWEIVINLSAATELGWKTIEDTDKHIKVLFVNPVLG